MVPHPTVSHPILPQEAVPLTPARPLHTLRPQVPWELGAPSPTEASHVYGVQKYFLKYQRWKKSRNNQKMQNIIHCVWDVDKIPRRKKMPWVRSRNCSGTSGIRSFRHEWLHPGGIIWVITYGNVKVRFRDSKEMSLREPYLTESWKSVVREYTGNARTESNYVCMM